MILNLTPQNIIVGMTESLEKQNRIANSIRKVMKRKIKEREHQEME